ncbi:MAG: hypothetical protein ACXABY_14190 [Candidatus Thorarchaeota archaeon]
MPEWKPEPIWEGQDAFVIGGGTSLRDFDWELLRHEHTVGCNNAFRKGTEICDVCVFADRQFLFDGPKQENTRKGFYDEIAKYGQTNLVITNDNTLRHNTEPWLYWMMRKKKGIHRDGLGFNANTGSVAINVALLLGAKTIFLLGFDMHLDKNGQPNYHKHLIDKPSPEVYVRMLASFGHVSRGLSKFPGCKVYNVNADSSLELFEKLDPAEFWAVRKAAKLHKRNTVERTKSCLVA